ncbi:hypothetical protein JHK86_000527 [Glycine max]|nr:hypothetical protein JHK86_000527 [Glycine max]
MTSSRADLRRISMLTMMTGKKKSTKPEALGIQELETLELLDKPSLVPIKNESFSEIDVHSENVCIEEDVLAPFLKFFKGSSDSVVEEEEVGGVLEGSKERGDESEEAKKTSWLISWDCSRDRCFCGFRTSGLEKNQLPGTMLTKEVFPLFSKEMEHLLCDVNNVEECSTIQGKIGILKNDDAINGIKQLGEPIEVRITKWNTKGLLTRIEGLRAFLPKVELMRRVNSFTELKENAQLKSFLALVSLSVIGRSLYELSY